MPKNSIAPETGQPTRSMSRTLAANDADQQAEGAPVAAVAEVDVLAALRLAAAAAQDVDG